MSGHRLLGLITDDVRRSQESKTIPITLITTYDVLRLAGAGVGATVVLVLCSKTFGFSLPWSILIVLVAGLVFFLLHNLVLYPVGAAARRAMDSRLTRWTSALQDVIDQQPTSQDLQPTERQAAWGHRLASTFTRDRMNSLDRKINDSEILTALVKKTPGSSANLEDRQRREVLLRKAHDARAALASAMAETLEADPLESPQRRRPTA